MFKILHYAIIPLFFWSAVASGQTEEAPFQNYKRGFNKDVLTLQTLLDRQDISCNMIDGRWGARTEIALVTWQTIKGRSQACPHRRF
jgi:hypothetical protein